MLECMLQQHNTRSERKGKGKQHTQPRLLLSVAKNKEYTNQHIENVGHECIETTRLLLGVAKCKEYGIQQTKMAKRHVNSNDMEGCIENTLRRR